MTGTDDDIAPPMTPRQLIWLLDRLCEVACASRRHKRDGQIVYSLSVDDIHEGDAILDGTFHESKPVH